MIALLKVALNLHLRHILHKRNALTIFFGRIELSQARWRLSSRLRSLDLNVLVLIDLSRGTQFHAPEVWSKLGVGFSVFATHHIVLMVIVLIFLEGA